MISRKYAAYDKDADVITMTRPIIGPDAECEFLSIPPLNLLSKLQRCSDFSLRREGSRGRCQSPVRPVGRQEGQA